MCARFNFFDILKKHLKKYLNFLTMIKQTKISNKKNENLLKFDIAKKKNELLDCYLKFVIVVIKNNFQQK